MSKLSFKVDHDVAVKDVERIDREIERLAGEIAKRERQIAGLERDRRQLEHLIATLAGQLGRTA
jgi:septal ring factor EnvC (AmiA/AmiB activator)